MEQIKAKSIITDRFWILQNTKNKKVGELQQGPAGNFEVRIAGKAMTSFSSLESLKKSPMFQFVDLLKTPIKSLNDIEGYPIDGTAFNTVWNVKLGLPLYTQTDESKSWHAAGYYKVNVHGTWVVQFCPKLIALRRTEYLGPYKDNPSFVQFNKMFKS